MFYEQPAIELSRELLESGNLSYSQLASHLERIYPRKDNPWTKDSAYHLCRINGINSKRRCKSQPSAGQSQRNNTRKTIITATLDALSASGRTITDIAPVQLKEIVMLSRASLYSVRSNWNELEDELNSMAGV